MAKFQMNPPGASGGSREPFLNGAALVELGPVGSNLDCVVKGVSWFPVDTVTPGKFGKPRRAIPGPPTGPADQTLALVVEVRGSLKSGTYKWTPGESAAFVLAQPRNLGDDADDSTQLPAWSGKAFVAMNLPSAGGSRTLRVFPADPFWAEQERQMAARKLSANGQQPAPVTQPPAQQQAAPAPARESPEDILARAERTLAEAKARQEAAERALKPLPVEPAQRSHKKAAKKK